MSALITYNETATFIKPEQTAYRGTQQVESMADVKVVFLQNTGFDQNNHQEYIDADAICFVDPTDSFVIANANRLEGMYVICPLFGASDAQAWYKVTSATVNRDHLLTNNIDNIELLLKKTSPFPLVS